MLLEIWGPVSLPKRQTGSFQRVQEFNKTAEAALREQSGLDIYLL